MLFLSFSLSLYLPAFFPANVRLLLFSSFCSFRGRGRRTESERPDVVAFDDEQHPAGGGGNRDERTGLRITSKEPEPQTEGGLSAEGEPEAQEPEPQADGGLPHMEHVLVGFISYTPAVLQRDFRVLIVEYPFDIFRLALSALIR